MNKYAKAIVAAVLAGASAFATAPGSDGHRLILAVVAAVVTGLVTWGVPNTVTTELKAIAGTIEHTATGATQVFPQVPEQVK
jgi:hypothetical protein